MAALNENECLGRKLLEPTVVLFLVYVDGSEVDCCEATHLTEEGRFTAVPLHVVSQGTWSHEGTMTLAALVD